MAVYKIVVVDEADVLRKRAKEILKVNDSTKRLLQNMADTMEEFKGVGLAAPQIGISKRAIVVDFGEGIIELVNPVITGAEGEQTGVEGCLSVPGLSGEVTRAQKIVVEGLNGEGKEVKYEVTDFPAVIFQHEIDHLDGTLFIDKAVNIKKV
ncbi:MAG TPA: peptide deformylase [Clostridia bacterium]|nr:peptide deformylase [Clostridia bacterium]